MENGNFVHEIAIAQSHENVNSFAEATLRNFIAVGYLDVKMQPEEELESVADK